MGNAMVHAAPQCRTRSTSAIPCALWRAAGRQLGCGIFSECPFHIHHYSKLYQRGLRRNEPVVSNITQRVDEICRSIRVPLPSLLSNSRLAVPKYPNFVQENLESNEYVAELERQCKGRSWTRGTYVRHQEEGTEDSVDIIVPDSKFDRMTAVREYFNEVTEDPEKNSQEKMDWVRDVLCVLRRDGLLVDVGPREQGSPRCWRRRKKDFPPNLTAAPRPPPPGPPLEQPTSTTMDQIHDPALGNPRWQTKPLATDPVYHLAKADKHPTRQSRSLQLSGVSFPPSGRTETVSTASHNPDADAIEEILEDLPVPHEESKSSQQNTAA